MASESLEDSNDKSRISSQSVQPPAKRQKLDSFHYSTDEEINSIEENNSIASSDTLAHDFHEVENKENQKEENAKSKSKHKIHIPKKSKLPSDTFYTQPPQKSSSPYRIDEFRWHKPRKQSPPTVSVRPGRDQHQMPENPHVNTISAGEEQTPCQPQHHKEADDEFSLDESYEDLLADLPSEAFTSAYGFTDVTGQEPIFISSQQEYSSQPLRNHRLAAPLANLRQTTLFGTPAQGVPSQTQSSRKHNWPIANREETPTHHKLDQEALTTWVYPINLGTIRDYQYSIVARGLYHNMLVALPTGLGKTFIAATIMLNWFRWTTESQIVFVAPTKPLVSQQVKACFDIAGIPRSATTMLTGGISPGLRAEEWQSKRVFFMTPQTIINDLKTGICDPKRLVLLVVDEAHRATGNYAYVEVVNFLKRFNSSFRVLALTATPGASIEKVQEVIDGLGISRVEIRTEESIDIRQYVHSRKIETTLFENSDEMVMVMELFSRALQPVLNKLTPMNAYWSRDPMTLTPYGCNQARSRWMSSNAGRKANMSLKGMVNTIFSLLASLSQGIELLKFHGIGPFYQKVLAFRNELHSTNSNDKKGGKYAKQINESEPFQTMMSRVQIWTNNPDFVGHPKLEYLQSVVLNHFLDAGGGRGASDPSNTRIMIFSHYRYSADEIARVLKRNEPMIRPHVFVGQASSKGSDGMDQKKQLDIIENFQTGIYNTLVATSIGEEGLDIGEVDLIVCYDASASPIRMLQRMGRTGRKRAGNIVVTLMKGKEEDNFIKAKDNYEKMQKEIASGTRFNFHDEESKRIVPRDIVPVVDKKIIEIPPENTQANLPEPTKRGGKPPKRPAKKFHMPDGVPTGFVKASRMGNDEEAEVVRPAKTLGKSRRASLPSPEPLPSLEEVLLNPVQQREFERRYLDIQGEVPQIVEVPRVDAFPHLQRSLRPTKHIGHSLVTKRAVGMLRAMHNITPYSHERYKRHLESQDEEAGQMQAEKRALYFTSSPAAEFSSQILCGSKAPAALNTSRRSSTGGSKDILPEKDPIAVSSADELASDDSLNDFLNDNIGEEMDLDIVTSKSTPRSLRNSDRPLYELREEVIHSDADSDDGLPEFDTLVQKGESEGRLHKSLDTTPANPPQQSPGTYANDLQSISDLLRRLPPSNTSANLTRICALAPDLTEELLSSVDQPLEVRRCRKSGRDYLLCDYNRDGDSWRSPWSNEFEPAIEGEEEGAKPSERVRKLEVGMGEAVDVYRELYYEGGVSSVYFWDLDDGFAGVVLLKKTTPTGKSEGGWDSIHVFESIDRARTSHYKLTSTVILRLSTESEALGEMDLSGNMTRQIEQDMPVTDDSSHIVNVGKLVEDMELKMRNLLQEVYFGKAKDVVGDLRSIPPLTEANREKATHQEMINSMKR